MGSLLDQLQKKSRVIIHISNPQIQQHQYAKMASFKILLVVALVAFIGSSDALKCMDTVGRSSAAKSVDCADGETSCFITAKITLAGAKPSLGDITKQACNAKKLGELTKKFEHPEKIENDSEVSFYCTTDDCNVAEEITKVIKENVADTIAAMKGVGTVKAGAAQTSVAVATITFSMAMARLAL